MDDVLLDAKAFAPLMLSNMGFGNPKRKTIRFFVRQIKSLSIFLHQIPPGVRVGIRVEPGPNEDPDFKIFLAGKYKKHGV